ncbi:hypothetical protein BU24DRAFT_461520 [Aaosphaeria arxii CBS 175.79]|uniref:Uncharacterized protein n=1 Tax=Aaosphaeria arxii CBS 175.79 TaxID=1450172 RepID=A0A6A5XPU4_9PLEO|nr:uncharacterized protein BU24DRAFT_461520 [Aaosphaeria arxii CBS 175.79]KAF2015268.1 hypothetical protein BU24DRAFT_461520 [Aaosphaeria arxii CBS 175.79]
MSIEVQDHNMRQHHYTAGGDPGASSKTLSMASQKRQNVLKQRQSSVQSNTQTQIQSEVGEEAEKSIQDSGRQSPIALVDLDASTLAETANPKATVDECKSPPIALPYYPLMCQALPSTHTPSLDSSQGTGEVLHSNFPGRPSLKNRVQSSESTREVSSMTDEGRLGSTGQAGFASSLEDCE